MGEPLGARQVHTRCRAVRTQDAERAAAADGKVLVRCHVTKERLSQVADQYLLSLEAGSQEKCASQSGLPTPFLKKTHMDYSGNMSILINECLCNFVSGERKEK